LTEGALQVANVFLGLLQQRSQGLGDVSEAKLVPLAKRSRYRPSWPSS